MAAISFVFLLSASASAAPGDLDPTFGNGGISIVSPSVASAQAVAVAPDGKIVVAGYYRATDAFQFIVARLLGNGTPDPSFGTNGVVTTPANLGSSVQALTVLSDGRIVAAGTMVADFETQVAVVRYLDDGTLDSSFGGDGIALALLSGMTQPTVRGMALQADGSVVVGGSVLAGEDRSDGYDVFLVRFDGDGDLDASFGGDGIVTAAIGPYDDFMAGFRLDGSGRIVVGGFSGIDIINDDLPAHFVFSLARFLGNGTLDATFGTAGAVLTDVRPAGTARMSGLVLQNDGTIHAVGVAYQSTAPGARIAIARYDANGALQLVEEPLSADGMRVWGVGRDAAGRLLVTGTRFEDGGLDSGNVALLRFTTDGHLDTAFGVGGLVKTDVAGFVDEGFAVTTDASERIVVAGSTYDGDQLQQMVALRYAGGTCSNGAACNDGDPCTAGETCSAGACTGPAAPNGTSCDDGSVCTSGETCSAGTCSGGTTTECQDCFGCDAVAGCIPAIEPVCADAERGGAKLRVGRFEGAPLSWRWRGEGPDAVRGMKLCVFDAPAVYNPLGWVEAAFLTTGEGSCTPDGCWRGGRRGLRYSSKTGGITHISWRNARSGRDRLRVRAELGAGVLLPENTPLLVQLTDAAGGCWQSRETIESR